MAPVARRPRSNVNAAAGGSDWSQSRDVSHATSDQAPGEETVQVNDRYSGGGPPPEPAQSEHGQHQTGG
jgi:hypothetical protein